MVIDMQELMSFINAIKNNASEEEKRTLETVESFVLSHCYPVEK